MNDDARAVPVAEFEGEFVRVMEGKLPAIGLEMPAGYKRGTHLLMQLEVRVRNVSYVEDRKGDLIRQHTFAIEDASILEAFDPASRPTNVGGSAASDSWVPELMRFVTGESNELDFDGEEIPDRLREMLKVYFDRATDDEPTIKPHEIEVDF